MAANSTQSKTVVIKIKGAQPSQKSVSMNVGDNIQFDSDGTYTIDWVDETGKSGTYWKPQPKVINPGLNPSQNALPSADKHTLTYTLNGRVEAQGTGTVKVGS